ncbi:CNP1-like family protein [Undibacterium cyanobacteriorum]|uniref:CNP1-like family protein n=1 Tax=Undibacterium cyanobacteriorum TaxID=3073561 RepID=A0ABY9RGA3_9BURK|nr:CNP1-like family protein [Undibacterium sp. 20NA77.5]WMW79894.1 CNP1-like family protein [Undibacterium sp. 20NA77.5]
MKLSSDILILHQSMRYVFSISVVLSCFSGVVSHAQAKQDEEVKKAFVESEVKLPSAPQEKDLLLFHSSDSQQFYLDTQSLSIAADGSFRYTLVAKSRAGARSISYEGLRCETSEKRLFAFGRKDGEWSESRRKEWSSISSSDSNQQHGVLAWDFVCSYGRVVGGIDKITQRVRRGESLQRSP